MRVALVNPNTNASVTAMMATAAQAAAPSGWSIAAITAPRGPRLITTPGDVEEAAGVVASLADELKAFEAVIVAAFADPGVEALTAAGIDVVGIAEAAMTTAARHGRFSVATTTPALRGLIEARAAHHGLGAALASVRTSTRDPADLMGDPAALDAALARAVDEAVSDGARAVVIGGGPLTDAAERLRAASPVPLIVPIHAALSRLIERRAARHDAPAPID